MEIHDLTEAAPDFDPATASAAIDRAAGLLTQAAAILRAAGVPFVAIAQETAGDEPDHRCWAAVNTDKASDSIRAVARWMAAGQRESAGS